MQAYCNHGNIEILRTESILNITYLLLLLKGIFFLLFFHKISGNTNQCQEVKDALKSFLYFESWDEKTISDCCRVSRVIEYLPDSIIVGFEYGNLHMVHFILDGSCRLIQHLQVHSKKTSYGKKVYKMYEPKESQSPTSDSKEASYTSLLFNRKLTVTEPQTQDDISETIGFDDSKVDIVLDKEAESPVDDVFEKDEMLDVKEIPIGSRETIPSIEIEVAEEPAVETLIEETKELEKDKEVKVEEKKQEEITGTFEELKLEDEEEEEEEEIKEEGSLTPVPKSLPEEEEEEEEEEKEIIEEVIEVRKRVSYAEDHHLKILEECRLNAIVRSESSEKQIKPAKPRNVESHFMEIGVLLKGECFGLGESLQDRFILSVTKVKCLLIPRHFLLQHNSCNIWNRIKQFLTLYLPTNEKIVRNFIVNREWAEYIREESLRIVSMKKIPNFTLENDVPLSIRITEDILGDYILHQNEEEEVKKLSRRKMFQKSLSSASEQSQILSDEGKIDAESGSQYLSPHSAEL